MNNLMSVNARTIIAFFTTFSNVYIQVISTGDEPSKSANSLPDIRCCLMENQKFSDT